MPASSFLRLVALGACAGVVEAFATIKRPGTGETEQIGTESAGGGGSTLQCPCAYSSLWYCTVSGTQSLSNPAGDMSFNNNVLAAYVNTCWNFCYKSAPYTKDGSTATYYDRCSKPLVDGKPVPSDPSEIWRKEMCKIEGGTRKWVAKLFDSTKANPFTDSCPEDFRDEDKGLCTPDSDDPNLETDNYNTFLCIDLNEEGTADALADTRTALQRCQQVTQENSAQITGTCNKAMKQMRTDSRFVGQDDAYICSRLYKYWELDGNRMYTRCEYDRDAEKCKFYVMDGTNVDDPTNTLANECKLYMCGERTINQCRTTASSPASGRGAGGLLNGAGTFQGFPTNDDGIQTFSHQCVSEFPDCEKCRPDCGNPDQDCGECYQANYQIDTDSNGNTCEDPCAEFAP